MQSRPVDALTVLRPGLLPYRAAWDLQRRLHAERLAGDRGDTVVLLEHPPTYTAGRRTLPVERPVDGSPVVDVDRGGKITWHGPGQLVGYPIVRLAEPLDVVAHVRRLEQALLAACAALDVAARRVEGRSGVWTADGARKIAAIGVRVTRGVTLHGFALNVCCDLEPFARIIPCGIADAGVTSLSVELGRPVPVAQVDPLVERALTEALLPCPA